MCRSQIRYNCEEGNVFAQLLIDCGQLIRGGTSHGGVDTHNDIRIEVGNFLSNLFATCPVGMPIGPLFHYPCIGHVEEDSPLPRMGREMRIGINQGFPGILSTWCPDVQ